MLAFIKRAQAFAKPYCVSNGKKFRLNKIDPDDTAGLTSEAKAQAKEALQMGISLLAELQDMLYAQDRWALLLIFQAMDAAGKDGAIKHVMSGVNPQGCEVYSFKAPSANELDHDYLWRTHLRIPERGRIGIFNRSYYEEVLIVRVHNLVPPAVWKKRYDQINDFERMLADSGTYIIKFFLSISKDEQKERFEERIADKTKNWKFNPEDLKEREYWDDYQRAFEDAIERCSTKEAPWYIIPANRKWYRNLAVSEIIRDRMEAMDLKYPKPTADLSKIKFE